MTDLARELAAFDEDVDVDHRLPGQGLGRRFVSNDELAYRHEREGYPATLLCRGCGVGRIKGDPMPCPRCGLGGEAVEEATGLAPKTNLSELLANHLKATKHANAKQKTQ